MGTEDTHGLGYQRVDDDPNVAVLLATMEGTARWDATRRLRSWERDQLALTSGERLLDVGCGLGEAALALAEDLGDGGAVVGIDVSEQMLRSARMNARSARCRVRFTAGDACFLDEPDDSFDAARSELLFDGEPCRRPRRQRSAGERRPAAVRLDHPRRRASRSVLDAPDYVRSRLACH